jgi:hypothetical protein
MNDPRPLIHTTKGNLPVAELDYDVRWEDAPGYTKLIETYRLGDEIVRESAHVMLKRGATTAGIAADIY